MKSSQFKALADDNRLQILQLLLTHDHCVRSLSRKLGISESAVSQHIKLLREAGFLYGEKHGHFTHYKVDRQTLRILAKNLATLADLSGDPAEESHPVHSCHCCKHSTGGKSYES